MFRRLTVLVLFTFIFGVGCADSKSNLFGITVKSGTDYPTLVVTGSTVTAYFTVTNRLSRTYNNVTARDFPANVSQVTSGGTYADTCTNPAVLAANTSCTLQLTISGAVPAGSSITACLNGNLTCQRGSTPWALRELSSVEITPETFDGAVGDTQQFTATGTFADDSTDDITSDITWTSSDATLVSVSESGLATALATGSGTLVASYDILESNEATFTVTPDATLSDISITPIDPLINIGTETQQFTATGTYDDASQVDITNLVTWQSSDLSVATISATGLATALDTGWTDISATLDSVISNVSMFTVVP